MLGAGDRILESQEIAEIDAMVEIEVKAA